MLLREGKTNNIYSLSLHECSNEREMSEDYLLRFILNESSERKGSKCVYERENPFVFCFSPALILVICTETLSISVFPF